MHSGTASLADSGSDTKWIEPIPSFVGIGFFIQREGSGHIKNSHETHMIITGYSHRIMNFLIHYI
jgi:hypothetical protein